MSYEGGQGRGKGWGQTDASENINLPQLRLQLDVLQRAPVSP